MPDDAVASWIDANTLRCHAQLLERLHTVRNTVLRTFRLKEPSGVSVDPVWLTWSSALQVQPRSSGAEGVWELADPYQRTLDAHQGDGDRD